MHPPRPSSARHPAQPQRKARPTAGQSGRGAPTVMLLVLIVAVLAAVSLWLLEDSADSGASSLPAAPVRSTDAAPVIQAPALAPGESLTVQDPSEAFDAPLDPLQRAEQLARYERGTLVGRLVLAEGGPLPEGLSVEACRHEPYPRVRSFSLSQIRELAAGAAFEGVEDGVLRQLTTTPVGADGRFEMHEAPAAESFWLAVVSDSVYQPRPRPVQLSAVDGELLVTVTAGATLSGRVLTTGGKPVAGIGVGCQSSVDPFAMIDGTTTMVELPKATTDGDGAWQMGPVPVELALVLSSARADGYRPQSLKLLPLAPGERRHVELHVERGAVLAGRVLDTKGAPVVGTTVRLQPTTMSMGSMDMLGNSLLEVDQQTLDEGRFRFEGLADGGYKLHLVKGGFLTTAYGPFEVSVDAPFEGVELLADRGLSVSGRVVDRLGEALPDVRVQGALPISMMSMRSRIDGTLRRPATSDDRGRFVLTGFEPGEVHLSARAEGFSAASLDVSAGDTDVVLTLERQTSVRGIAIDLASGDPLERYTLRASPSGSMGIGDLMDMGERMQSQPAILRVDDPEGRFEMQDIDPGTYDLVLQAEGYARTVEQGIVVERGTGASGVILMVPEEARLLGQVLSGRDGSPLADVTVTTGKIDTMATVMAMFNGPSQQTLTDSDGRFDLGSLGAEPVTLTFKHRAFRVLSLPATQPIPGEAFDIGLVTLPPGATVWGHVFDGDGRPEAGVAVMASDARGTQLKRATSDAEGRYEIVGLAAGTLNVMRMDMSFQLDGDNPMSALEDMVFRSVTLEDDESKKVDLGGPDEGGCLLSGRVLGAAGAEADAMLVLVREDGDPSTRFASSDDEGDYAFAGVQPGDYLLQVIPSDSISAGGSQPASPVLSTLTIGDAARQRHDVSVPGGALRGEVRAARDGERLSGVRVLLERTDADRPASRFLGRMGGRVGEAYTDDEGVFVLRHLPPGTYAVTAGGTNILGLGDAGWAMKRVEELPVREGSEGFAVVIELDPGCAIAGVVSGPDGEPLEGIPVWAKDESTGRWLSSFSEVVTDSGGHYAFNSLTQGSYTLAIGGDAWALAIHTGVRTQRDAVKTHDVELERGVEVLARLHGHDASALSFSVTGPRGEDVPTHLTSVDQLLGGSRLVGEARLGRVSPGTYGVDVYERGEVLLQKVVSVRADTDPLWLELPEPDGQR